MTSTRLPPAQLFDLGGKTAIVTGGTGGLGYEMTLTLAEAGADIVSIQLPNDPAGPALQKAVNETGRKITVFECDLSNSAALRASFQKAWESGVVPDILLNCAGLNRRGRIETMQDADIDLIFAVNQKATYVAAQEVGRKLLELNRPGKIINVASLASILAGVNVAAYAATKGAVAQLTKAFSNEWAEKGIQVNAISPGYFITPLTTDFQKDKTFTQHITDRIPAHRWGNPEDLRGAVLFLASSASNFVNGHNLVVDGGMAGR